MCLCNCVNTKFKFIWNNRKDSFITHRAFCDALTQENSRMDSFPMMSSTPNLNFRHNLMMMNNGGGGGMRFTGMFGSGMLEPNLEAISLKPRVPIWLDQNVNESHLENPSSSSFLGSSSSNNNIGEMLPSEMMQWMNGNHETMVPYSGLHLKEEEDNKGEMFNSMYNNYTTLNSSAHMSATALLQKAAQMGSTKSTNNGDTNAFGLMSTSTLDSLNFDNGDGLMMMMNPTNSKPIKGNGLNELRDSDLTRDFLGVGENERSSFNLQQGLFKFTTSMDKN